MMPSPPPPPSRGVQGGLRRLWPFDLDSGLQVEATHQYLTFLSILDFIELFFLEMEVYLQFSCIFLFFFQQSVPHICNKTAIK